MKLMTGDQQKLDSFIWNFDRPVSHIDFECRSDGELVKMLDIQCLNCKKKWQMTGMANLFCPYCEKKGCEIIER